MPTVMGLEGPPQGAGPEPPSQGPIAQLAARWKVPPGLQGFFKRVGLGLGGLASPTYDLAKKIVAAYESNSFLQITAALSELSTLSAEDQALTLKKAIGLGLDPVQATAIAKTIGATEVIEVVSNAPPVKPTFPLWAKIAIGVVVAGGAVYGAKKIANKRKAVL